MSCVKFSPSRALLVSCSWDKTVRLWDVFEKKGNFETFQVNTLGLFACERKMESGVMKMEIGVMKMEIGVMKMEIGE